MYTYTNPAYEPEIHDFGDDYHKPDSLEELEGASIITRVKKIRRRYQNWFDYNDACTLYDQYMKNLFKKYGGKKNFRLMKLLGRVTDYLPNYPELRKNRKNRFLSKNSIARTVDVKDPFEKDGSENILMGIYDPSNVKVKVRLNGAAYIDQYYQKKDAFNLEQISQISDQLDMLNAYFVDRVKRIEKLKARKKVKKKMRTAINRESLKMAMQYRSLSDKIKLYDENEYNEFMGINKSNEPMMTYKEAVYTAEQAELQELIDQLREIGVQVNKVNRHKVKVIRRKNMKHKKKKHRKNRSIEDKFVENFTGDEYDDYREFEDAVINETVGTRRFE
jgi:hypothetical protein